MRVVKPSTGLRCEHPPGLQEQISTQSRRGYKMMYCHKCLQTYEVPQVAA